MQAYRFPKFIPLYDGQMSKAVEIVNTMILSENFTKRDWEGKEEFLLKQLERFNEYRDILRKEIEERGMDDSDRKESDLDLFEQAIAELGESGELSYAMMVRVYVEIMQYMRKATYGFSKFETFEDPEREGGVFWDEVKELTVQGVIENLREVSSKHPNIVPITGITGAYGLNTFLYLFFNNLHPVGIGYKELMAHGQKFGNLVLQIFHDFDHIGQSKTITSASIILLKDTYNSIFTHYNEIGR